MKEYVKSVATLVLICGVVAVLLAGVNGLTAPIIREQEEAAANEGLLAVMPDGKDFKPMDLAGLQLPATVTAAYSEAGGGHVFTLTTSGYSSGFVILCGVAADGTVTGAMTLSSNETLGEEATYGDTLKGATAETVDKVDTIAGATKTTAAYRAAVKDALNAALLLGGKEVDLRTEEEILQDNLTAALPAAQGKFTRRFLTEVTPDISALYVADNGTGAVCVSGKDFIPVDPAGKVLTDMDAAKKEAVSRQAAALLTSTRQKVDLTAYPGLDKLVTEAEKTASGNWIFVTKGAGFGINGDSYSSPSGEPIVVRTALTPDGVIIACETVSQKETEGIGSACASPAFTGQFSGKQASNYTEIDAIAGATYTTDGYKMAVGQAFKALSLVKGGA